VKAVLCAGCRRSIHCEGGALRRVVGGRSTVKVVLCASAAAALVRPLTSPSPATPSAPCEEVSASLSIVTITVTQLTGGHGSWVNRSGWVIW